ncbi:class I SAM-dependent methyltransferase [Streptomyces sp. NPDC012421]|uniref:class I SAM-dependent methyltransferase n=1 Tax=Streptomyces sp. NPDC012421 TaxID=3364832 RepID=UPI0036E9CB2A
MPGARRGGAASDPGGRRGAEDGRTDRLRLREVPRPSLGGSVLRRAVFDGWVRRFLAEHPDGTVVELGAGLDTRSRRPDNGRARWFDLDLPDTAELRLRFLPDSERTETVAASVLDTDWFERVAATGGPYFSDGHTDGLTEHRTGPREHPPAPSYLTPSMRCCHHRTLR